MTSDNGALYCWECAQRAGGLLPRVDDGQPGAIPDIPEMTGGPCPVCGGVETIEGGELEG